MSLPVLVSVPHGGLAVPAEVEEYNLLTARQVEEDGDEFAMEIYSIQDHVRHWAGADVARAFVDLNRAEDDMSIDGVIKTHTCWKVPVYKAPLPDQIVRQMLANYYHPYHQRLDRLKEDALICLDCHTMAAFGPPVGPDSGKERPFICLSDAGRTCPEDIMAFFKDSLEEELGLPVSLNHPFGGGYIIRKHFSGTPWIQVEFTRSDKVSHGRKREGFALALEKLVKYIKDR